MKLPSAEIVGTFFQRMTLAAACGFAVLLAGCDPQSIIRWAPDGAHAIVSVVSEIGQRNRTFLVDAEGKIVAQAPDAKAWMPDSRRVIVIRSVPARSWEEVAALAGEERAHAIIRAADELAALIREYHGDWKKFLDLDSIKHWEESNRFGSDSYAISNGELSIQSGALLPYFYLVEKHPDVVEPLTELFKRREDFVLGNASAGIRETAKGPMIVPPNATNGVPLNVNELLVRNALPDDPADEKLLLRSIDFIEWARPSPNGKMIAAIVHEPERPGLYAIPVDGGDRVAVDSGAAEADWTPDSQWLVYAKTTLSYERLESQVLLGTITRSHVCDEGGRMIPKESPEDLAGVLYGKGVNHVACLPDGRILFSGLDAGMPMNTRNSAVTMKLFLLRPGEGNKIERIAGDEPGNYLPSRADPFSFNTEGRRFAVLGGSSILPQRPWSLSPDGKRVAVLGGDGGVAVITLETGAVQEVLQGKLENLAEDALFNKQNNVLSNEQSIISVIPAWRSGTELSYVCPAGNPVAGPRRAEVALRSLDGAPRVISSTWSDELTDAFLMRPKEATKPQ